MSLSDMITNLYKADFMPDWARLNGVIYVVDGCNPNIIMDRNDANIRIMGAYPLTDAPVASNAGSGTALENGKDYIWAVRRKITYGSTVIYSAYTLSNMLTSNGEDASIAFETDYEFAPQSGAEWTVEHTLYRSYGDVTSVLYKVEDIADGTSSPVTDDTVEGSLDTSDSITLANDDYYGWVPPVAYIRNWEGKLVCGGTHTYDEGTVSGTAAASTVTLASPGQVREADINGYLTITGEPWKFSITDVDETANTWTISPALENTHTASTYKKFHNFNAVYICHALGTSYSVEAYSDSTNKLLGAEDSGDPMRGLAVNGAHCYVFHQKSTAQLVFGVTSYYEKKIPGFPGCANHATIDDRNGYGVIWYAGENGVWLAIGTDAKKLSTPVDDILTNTVDHSRDRWSHGTFDPERQMYHLWVFQKGVEVEQGLRVPNLMLSYDIGKDQWYVGECLASCSTVAHIEHRQRVVIGLPGGVAILNDSVAYDGQEQRLHWGSADTDVSGLMTFDTATRPTGDDGVTTETWADFYVQNQGLAGFPIHLVKYDSDGYLSSIQRRIIKTNGPNNIELWTDWTTAPVEGDELVIGAIRWHAEVDDANLMPDWHREKNPATNVKVLVEPAPTQYANKMTMTMTGRRTKSSFSVLRTIDMYDKELLEGQGSEFASHGRSIKARIEGNTTKAVTIKGLMVDRSRATESE